jgi:hypothetical protein
MTAGSYCADCGAKIEPNSNFCSSCGKASSLGAAAAGAIPTDNNSETKWPGKGLKKAGKVIALIGLALIVLLMIGGGGEGFAASILVVFPLVILPGWIIYGIGGRKYKKAINASLVPSPPKIKVDTFADTAKAVLLVFTLVIGFIMTVVGIIVLHFGVMILGLILFLGPLAGLAGTGKGKNGYHNARDAFYMNRWGSYQAKKNMRRGHRRNK